MDAEQKTTLKTMACEARDSNRGKVWATSPLFPFASNLGVVDSVRMPSPPPALSALSRPEPEALLIELFGEVAALQQVAAEQREEIARLKGLKGRPTIRPSAAWTKRGTDPPKPGKPEKRRGRGTGDASGEYR